MVNKDFQNETDVEYALPVTGRRRDGLSNERVKHQTPPTSGSSSHVTSGLWTADL